MADPVPGTTDPQRNRLVATGALLLLCYLAPYMVLVGVLPHEWVTRQVLWFAILSFLILAAAKPITAVASWVGLCVGVVLGAFVGDALYARALEEFNRNPDAHTHLPFHYGWAMAIVGFLVGTIAGFLVERRRRPQLPSTRVTT